MTTEQPTTAAARGPDSPGNDASPPTESVAGPARWPSSRIAALAVAAAIAVIAVALLLRLGRTADMQLLYGSLGSADSAAIAAWLQDQGIRYHLDDGGTAILVPADIKHRARLELAAAGLPAEPGRMGPRFTGHDYPGALEYELSRTIGSMDGIRSARVILATAGPTGSDTTGRQSSAAIFLRREPEAAISRDQARDVVDLVAAAVVDIDPADVTIIDSAGGLIIAGDGELSVGGDAMLAFQHALEQRLERRAQQLLDTVLGPNRAIVRVNAAIDRSRLETTTELYDPDGQVIRRETTEEEAPSARSDQQLPPAAEGLDESYQPPSRRSETIDYEIGKTVSTRVTPDGTIARLSAVVLVSGQQEPNPTPGTGDAILATAADIVTAAIGIDADRGDEIIVMPIPRDSVEQARPPHYPPGALVSEYLPLIRILLAAAGLLAVYALLLRPLLKIVLNEYGVRFQAAAGEADPKEDVPSPGRQEKELEQAVREAVSTSPAAAAYILKRWIRES